MKRLALCGLVALFAASLAPALAQSGNSTAAMPTCSAGDPVVWENTKSKSHVYHMSGDKYYGTSKHGRYVCESQAKTDGYHAANMSGMKGAMGAAPSPAASGMPGMMGMHHKKHHMGMASPAPSPAAT